MPGSRDTDLTTEEMIRIINSRSAAENIEALARERHPRGLTTEDKMAIINARTAAENRPGPAVTVPVLPRPVDIPVVPRRVDVPVTAGLRMGMGVGGASAHYSDAAARLAAVQGPPEGTRPANWPRVGSPEWKAKLASEKAAFQARKGRATGDLTPEEWQLIDEHRAKKAGSKK